MCLTEYLSSASYFVAQRFVIIQREFSLQRSRFLQRIKQFSDLFSQKLNNR